MVLLVFLLANELMQELAVRKEGRSLMKGARPQMTEKSGLRVINDIGVLDSSDFGNNEALTDF